MAHTEAPAKARELIGRLVKECQRVVVGKTDIIENLLEALLSQGHILLEGVPGVAKTTLGKTFASALSLEFKRVQCSPDMMPADIVGTHIFDQSKGRFRLERGPIFTNLLLVDEINRNTPKTNSAVLEAMQEGQVTIEGETQPLPNPFLVIATQSPIDFHGVFPLPEVLVDRFLLSVRVDYPSVDEEIEIVNRFSQEQNEKIAPIATTSDTSYLTALSQKVYVASHVQSYIVDLVNRTRRSQMISLGASPRASIGFTKVSKARAIMKGRLYVVPDDVKSLAPMILRHRIVIAADQRITPDEAIEEILKDTPTPQRPLSVE